MAVCWSACPGARISLMSSSRSSGKGCDPSPNESDSWSLSPHGEVRTQILAPSTAALDRLSPPQIPLPRQSSVSMFQPLECLRPRPEVSPRSDRIEGYFPSKHQPRNSKGLQNLVDPASSHMLVSKPFLKRSRARFLPGPPLIILMVIHQWFMNGQGWFMNGQGWLRSRHVAEVSQAFLTDIFGQFIASCPVADFIGHCATSRTARGCCELIYNHTTPRMSHSHWTKASARTYVNMFEGPVTLRYEIVTATPKKTCLKDLSRATSRRSWTTER